MFFVSSTSPTAQSTQHLIIFCHAEERVLFPLPKSFEDAQELARGEFCLSGEPIFETDDLLEPSEGPTVRIHRTAWEGIRSILRMVTVKAAHAPAPTLHSRPSEAVSSGSRRLSSQKRASVVGSVPSRLSASSKVSVPPVARQSVSAKKGLLPAFSPKSSAVSAHKDVGPSRSGMRSSPRCSAPTTPVSSQIEEIDVNEEEEEEELRIPSPTKKRNVRPRVMSDYGIDAEEEEETDDVTGKPSKCGADVEEEFDQLYDADHASSPATKPRPASPASALSRSGSGSLVDLDGPSNSGLGTRRNDPTSSVRQLDAPALDQPRIKVEKSSMVTAKPVTPTLSQTKGFSQSSQPQSQSDDSFLIMIEYSKDPDSRSLFKTRGRHMVSKVLMQACRTFGLDEYYRSARLILVVEEDDGDDEIVYQRRYVCNRDQTMEDAGAEPNAKFVVELAHENDD